MLHGAALIHMHTVAQSTQSKETIRVSFLYEYHIPYQLMGCSLTQPRSPPNFPQEQGMIDASPPAKSRNYTAYRVSSASAYTRNFLIILGCFCGIRLVICCAVYKLGWLKRRVHPEWLGMGRIRKYVVIAKAKVLEIQKGEGGI